MLVIGVVRSVKPIAGKQSLRECEVDVGAGEDLIIVTNASNVRDGTRTVVALVGTEVEIDGETVVIKKTSVGGIMSCGMLCDAPMCGWVGGGVGIAVQVPPEFHPGDPAPKAKPRLGGGVETVSVSPAMSDKEIKAKEKAERKALLALKKEARRVEKAKNKGSVDQEENEEDSELADKMDAVDD